MTLHAPLFLQSDAALPEYSAEQMRVLTTLATNIGVEGFGDLQVTERAAGRNLSVDVAPGQAVITGTHESGQGRYAVESDAVVNVAIAPLTTPNSQRWDRIVAQIVDPAVLGGSAMGWNIYAFSGPVAAVGQAQIPGTPASSMTLARVDMRTNKAAIANADITDERMFSRTQYVGLATSMQGISLNPTGADFRIGGAHTWWGSTITLPRIGGEIRVWAQVTGAFRSVNATCWVWTRVHTSVDGGASWTPGYSMAGFSGSPLSPTPIANQHLVRARCTGEIRARVEVWSSVNMADLGGGVLVIHAAPAPPNLSWGV